MRWLNEQSCSKQMEAKLTKARRLSASQLDEIGAKSSSNLPGALPTFPIPGNRRLLSQALISKESLRCSIR